MSWFGSLWGRAAPEVCEIEDSSPDWEFVSTVQACDGESEFILVPVTDEVRQNPHIPSNALVFQPHFETSQAQSSHNPRPKSPESQSQSSSRFSEKTEPSPTKPLPSEPLPTFSSFFHTDPALIYSEPECVPKVDTESVAWEARQHQVFPTQLQVGLQVVTSWGQCVSFPSSSVLVLKKPLKSVESAVQGRVVTLSSGSVVTGLYAGQQVSVPTAPAVCSTTGVHLAQPNGSVLMLNPSHTSSVTRGGQSIQTAGGNCIEVSGGGTVISRGPDSVQTSWGGHVEGVRGSSIAASHGFELSTASGSSVTTQRGCELSFARTE